MFHFKVLSKNYLSKKLRKVNLTTHTNYNNFNLQLEIKNISVINLAKVN